MTAARSSTAPHDATFTRVLLRASAALLLGAAAFIGGSRWLGAALNSAILTFALQTPTQAGIAALDVRAGVLHPLWRGQPADPALAWSPDGAQWVMQPDASYLTVLRADGQPQFAITFADWLPTNPRWSPDGRWIAFEATSVTGMYDVFVTPARESAPRNLTNSPDMLEEFPVWTPDSRALAYQLVDFRRGFRVDAVRHIHLINLEEAVPRSLFTSGLFPAWLPDGERLVYFQWGLDRALILGEIDTDAPLEKLDVNARSVPAIAPDGQTVAYLKVTDDQALTLRLRRFADGATRDFPLPFARITPPVWSPQGDALAFAARDRAISIVVLLDVATGTLRQLHITQGSTLPAWRPGA